MQARIQELAENRNQLIANVNAIDGAMQDCEFWLAQLESEEARDGGQEDIEEGRTEEGRTEEAGT